MDVSGMCRRRSSLKDQVERQGWRHGVVPAVSTLDKLGVRNLQILGDQPVTVPTTKWVRDRLHGARHENRR